MPAAPLTASHDRPAGERGRAGLRSITTGFVVALAILIGLCVDVLVTTAEISSLSEERVQTRKLLLAVNGLYSAVQGAEIGLLSYLLTGAGQQLEAAERSRKAAELAVAEVRRLGSVHGALQAQQQGIERLVQMRLEQVDVAVAVSRRSGTEAGLALVRGGGGQATLASLQQVLAAHEEKLTALLDARTARTDAHVARQRIVLPAAGALSVGLLLAAYCWLRREIARRQAAVAALREANAQLALDVVERQRSAEELRGKNEELERATERARSADRVKSSFLATMSHELRTPLNSIIGFTGILLQELAGPLNPEQRKQLEMVRGSSRHLLALINDVLDISKIEAGELQVRTEPFDLRNAIERAVATVRPLAQRKQLALELVLPTDLGGAVGDPRRVEQILLNLLSNAVKFTAHGTITVTARVEGTQASVTVADTGAGIAASDLPSLFVPFRQLDTGLGRHQEGTGLGLVICRRLAELMSGSVSVSSEPGKGSAFTLVLPAAETRR